MYVVYILEEETCKRKYIGYTSDLRRRIAEHMRHKNTSTKIGTWRLIYAEAYIHKMDAIGRERFLKSGSGWKFIKKQLHHYLNDELPKLLTG